LPDTPDAVILSYEVGLVKPDPAIFRLVCDRLGLQPAEILFVGDTPAADIEGPCAIGMSAMLISEFEASLIALSEEDTNMATPTIKGSGLGRLVSLEEGKALLDEISVDDDSTDWAASELLSAPRLAQRLQIPLATLDGWRTANKAIAFCNETGEYIYPVRQFEGAKPVEGLDQVVTFFPSQEEAWEWLVTPCRYTNDEAPVDRLRSKHVGEVVRAAEGSNDFE